MDPEGDFFKFIVETSRALMARGTAPELVSVIQVHAALAMARQYPEYLGAMLNNLEETVGKSRGQTGEQVEVTTRNFLDESHGLTGAELDEIVKRYIEGE